MDLFEGKKSLTKHRQIESGKKLIGYLEKIQAGTRYQVYVVELSQKVFMENARLRGGQSTVQWRAGMSLWV